MINKIKAKLNNDGHLHELIKGSSIAFIMRLLGMVVGYIFSYIVAKKFGAEGTGILALTITYISIGTVLAKSGLDISIMKYIARFHDKNPQIIKGFYLQSITVVILLSIGITILFWSLSYINAKYLFNKQYLAEAFMIGSLVIIPMAISQLHAEALRGYRKITYYFFLHSVCASTIAIILLLLNVYPNFSQYVYIDIYLLAQSITALIALSIWLYNSHILNVIVKKMMSKKELFTNSLPIMISSSITMLMGWMDIIMLGAFMNEKDVGIYSIALKLAALTSISLIAVNSIVAPKISKMYSENDWENLQKSITQATKIIFWSSLPILLIFIFFPELLMGFFGQAFQAGAISLIILSMGQFFNATSGPVGQILNMTEKQHILRNTALMTVFFNIVLNYILIPIYGINGAAIATALSGIIWNILCIVYINRTMGISVFYIPGLKGGRHV